MFANCTLKINFLSNCFVVRENNYTFASKQKICQIMNNLFAAFGFFFYYFAWFCKAGSCV